MTNENFHPPALEDEEDLGFSGFPLCREPWESYYILRRGVMPCCYGHPILAPMSEYEKTWNSAELRSIREHLSRGKLSPYCRNSLACPIVQRVLAKEAAEERRGDWIIPPPPPAFLRAINRLLFRIPGKIWQAMRKS